MLKKFLARFPLANFASDAWQTEKVTILRFGREASLVRQVVNNLGIYPGCDLEELCDDLLVQIIKPVRNCKFLKVVSYANSGSAYCNVFVRYAILVASRYERHDESVLIAILLGHFKCGVLLYTVLLIPLQKECLLVHKLFRVVPGQKRICKLYC